MSRTHNKVCCCDVKVHNVQVGQVVLLICVLTFGSRKMIVCCANINKNKLTGIFPRQFSSQEKRPLSWGCF